jgi:hypothetical protein
MQLQDARLCMDCEEVHDAQVCPVCSSETFAYITRWIPAPDKRPRPRPPEPSAAETVNTYRELLSPSTAARSGVARWLRRGAVGLAAVTAVSWAWQRSGAPSPSGKGENGQGNDPTPHE